MTIQRIQPRLGGAWVHELAQKERINGAWVDNGPLSTWTLGSWSSATAPPAGSRLLIGATCNIPSNTPAVFDANQSIIGPLAVRRFFSSGLPTTMPPNNNGIIPFYSFKGNVANVTAGLSDATITQLARSIPDGGYVCSYHEPENDIDGPTFVAMTDHIYTVVKAANPTLKFGPVYMTYWWAGYPNVGKPGQGANPTTADSWLPNNFDFLGCDTYNVTPKTMETDAQMQNWFDWAKPYALAAGVKIAIVEYGAGSIPPAGMTPSAQATMETNRLAVMQADRTWVESEPVIGMWLLWNGTGAQGDWSLHDAAGQQFWAALAAANQ